MSKKKEPEKLPNPSPEESNLTPWQKANRKYLAEHGKQKDQSESLAEQQDSGNAPKDASELDEQIQEENAKQFEPEQAPEQDFEEIEQKKIGGPYNGSFLNRLPNLKSHRNKVLYRRLGLIIAVLGIPLIFLIYYVSPYSKLEAVTVTGNQVVTSQEAIAETKLKLGANIWKQYWHKDQYIDQLKKEQPRIKTAAISFRSVNQLDLKVTEYKEIALVSKENQYYPVIENGVVLSEKVANPTKNLPILEDFNENAKIQEFAKQYNQLSAELQKAISEIKYTPRDSNKDLIQLNMNDGNQVIVNITNLASQMKYYPQVAKEMDEKGVVDMEVGIFSYPYSSQDSTQGSEASEETAETAVNEEAASQDGESNETAGVRII